MKNLIIASIIAAAAVAAQAASVPSDYETIEHLGAGTRLRSVKDLNVPGGKIIEEFSSGRYYCRINLKKAEDFNRYLPAGTEIVLGGSQDGIVYVTSPEDIKSIGCGIMPSIGEFRDAIKEQFAVIFRDSVPLK